MPPRMMESRPHRQGQERRESLRQRRPAQHVADCVAHALTARKPKTRYSSAKTPASKCFSRTSPIAGADSIILKMTRRRSEIGDGKMGEWTSYRGSSGRRYFDYPGPTALHSMCAAIRRVRALARLILADGAEESWVSSIEVSRHRIESQRGCRARSRSLSSCWLCWRCWRCRGAQHDVHGPCADLSET